MQELDEQDYADLGASTPPSMAAASSTVSQITGQALGNSLGRVVGRNGVLSGDRLSGAITGPTGAIGRATGNIAEPIRSALAQFPVGQPGRPGGGP